MDSQASTSSLPAMKPAANSFFVAIAGLGAFTASAMDYDYSAAMDWTFEGYLVGQLPACESAMGEFCISRCHDLSVKLTSCCDAGVWKLNDDVTICDEACDQDDGETANCLAEPWGFAANGNLTDVPELVNTGLPSAESVSAADVPNNLKVYAFFS